MKKTYEKDALAHEFLVMAELLQQLGVALRKGQSLNGLNKARLDQLQEHKTKAKRYYQLVKLQETK